MTRYENIYRTTMRPLNMTLKELAEITKISKPRLAEYVIHGNRYAVTFEEMETVQVAVEVLNLVPIKYPRRRMEDDDVDLKRQQAVWKTIIEEMVDDKKEERKLESAAEEIMKTLFGPSEDETDYYGLYDAITYGGLENYGVGEFERRVRKKAEV